MGQHTWFYKSRELYEKEKEIDIEIDSIEKLLESSKSSASYLFQREYLCVLNEQSDNLFEQNCSEFHDIFRTSKRGENNEYCSDVIYSLQQTLDWIEKEENKVYFNQEKENAIKSLKKFWKQYPDGVIAFG